MNIAQVTVTFKKSVNDGHYGSEMAEMQYVATLEAGDDPALVAAVLLSRGRDHVIGQLGQSESIEVRRALNPPKRLCSYCKDQDRPLGDDESYSHADCLELRRHPERINPAGFEEDDGFSTADAAEIAAVAAEEDDDDD